MQQRLERGLSHQKKEVKHEEHERLMAEWDQEDAELRGLPKDDEK